MLKLLRHQQKGVVNTGASNVLWSRGKGNSAVLGVKEVVVHMALAAEPKVFNQNLGPNSMRSAYYPTTAKIVKLLTALRIHTLGYHAGPRGLLR